MVESTHSIHSMKELVKGLEEHTQRSELVYQQHIDILKGRLMDRDVHIEALTKELALLKGQTMQPWKEGKKSKSKDPQHFDQSLRESRRQLTLMFRSKMQQFQQILAIKPKSNLKKDFGGLTPEYHKKLLVEIAHLKSDRQTYERQLDAQSKLISQYQQEGSDRAKQLKQLKQRTRQNFKAETKKIIQLYTQKYKQLVCNYSSFFTDLTGFIRNQLQVLKRESTDSLGSIWQTLTQGLVRYAVELPSQTSKGSVSIDQSLLSREQMKQFQIEELRKQLLAVKAENCVMKFQLRRRDQRKESISKNQPMFDNNKYFKDSNEENDLKGGRCDIPRKDSSRGTRRSDRGLEGDTREQMTDIQERIKHLSNTQLGKASLSRAKWGVFSLDRI